jgi:biopolymer transport protein ExbD
MASPAQRPAELIHGINVTPLVDVVLVLLIVLMVTAQQAVSRALPLDLPRAGSGESTPLTPLAISVDASGVIFVDEQRLSKAQLKARIRAHGGGSERSATIAADGGAPHRAVVAVIDLLRGEGISKLAINVAPEERPR